MPTTAIENAARASSPPPGETPFRSLVENAQELIQIIDATGRTIYASPSVHRLLGYTPEEMVGRTARDDLHPDDLPATMRQLAEVIRSPGTVCMAEYRVRRKDGSWRVFEGYARTTSATSAEQGVVVNARDVTERKRAEDQLRFQRTLLKAQQENSLDGILVVSQTGEMISYNRRFVEMWGIPPEVMEQRSDGEAVRHVLRQVQEPEAFQRRIDELYRRRDGTGRDEIRLRDGRVFDRYSAPVRDEEGRYHGRIWSFRDVTDRKRVEEALRSSEQRFRSVVENSSDLVTLMDGAGVISYQSPAVERMFGYPPDALIGRNAFELVHPDDVATVADRLRQVAAHPGQPRAASFRFLHADGHWVHVEAVGSTLCPTSAEDGVVVNSRDITERKQAELRLQETTRFLESLIASSPGVIFRGSGETFETTYISPNAERLLGFSAERFLAHPQLWVDRTHPDDRAGVAATLSEAIAGGASDLTYEYRFLHRDGQYRNLLASVRFQRDAETGAAEVYGYTLDVSALKEAEAALRQAKEEAEAAREVAEAANRAKSDFLSRMSHELRTPMNSILGFAQLLEMAELEPNQHRAVERIHKAGKHLLNLINEVLDLARIEANQQSLSLEPVQVAPVLRETLSLIRPLAAQRSCQLREELPEAVQRYARADRQRLTQVLLNLLSNAVKYNRPGGEVSVLAGVREEAGAAAVLRVGIHDTGPGIPGERLAELFLPFSRLGAEQTEVEGTGLGLALSKTLVEAMGGRMYAESVLGDGSTFWVELPLAEDPLERAPGAEAEGAARQRRRISAAPATLLYIEDNGANLALIQELLAGYPEITLCSATRGGAGLEQARRAPPDLILLDLHLPDMLGTEVLRRLRADAATRAVPVVVISADATPRQIEHLRAAGAQEYLTKPLDLSLLLEVIARTLADPTGPPPGGPPVAELPR